MKSIVWLASYPKSGNTWLRAFLANYIRNGDEPCPLNKIHHLGMGDSSANTYQMVSKKPLDMNIPSEAVQLRHKVLRGIVNNRADVNFVKTHNHNGYAYNVLLVPPKLTRSAIYIVRNPLDMVGSYADHYGLTIDEAIVAIGHMNTTLPGGNENAHQFVGGWSNHVMGWTKTKKFPILLLLYEDMLKDPHTVFDAVIRHVGFPVDRERLEKAVRFSDFKTMSELESKTSFIEKSTNNDRFFRRGTSGNWKSELTNQQLDRVLFDHGRVMRKFGYET